MIHIEAEIIIFVATIAIHMLLVFLTTSNLEAQRIGLWLVFGGFVFGKVAMSVAALFYKHIYLLLSF